MASPTLTQTQANWRSISHPVNNRLCTATHWKIYRLTLLAGDALMILLSFWLAYRVRFQLPILIFHQEIAPSPAFYLELALISAALWLTIFALNGLYHQDNLLGGTQEYALAARGTTTGMLLLIVAGFLEPTLVFARGWLLTAWLATILLVAGMRFGLRRLIYWQRTHGYFLSPALIVGANQEGRLLAEQLWNWRTSGLHIVGILDNALPLDTPVYKHIKVLGRLADLEEIIRLTQAKEVIIASSALSREQMLPIFERMGFSKQVNLRLTSGLFEIVTTGLRVKDIGYVPLVQVNQLRMQGVDEVLKRALDLAIVLPGLIALAPLFLLLAVLVKLDSPGAVIYRRRVMGLNGTQFDALKFRSMHVNGDEILAQYPEKAAELAHSYKLADDPRLTRLGPFLRKFSLDELPQLFNVLRGQMSLVGPRMISPPEMAMYGHWGMNLLTVRPGITGMWQVSGRSELDYAERVRLDMNYIRNWTIWLDLQLLIRTIPAVLRGKGAY